MSKCSEIRDFCGDYAFDVEYSADNEFTMFFNSRRNAETVKRCIEVDDSVPNVATAVDFVEVVRCKDCKYSELRYGSKKKGEPATAHYVCNSRNSTTVAEGYCHWGEMRTRKNAETCVSCGAVIPEGRQVCPNCEKK